MTARDEISPTCPENVCTHVQLVEEATEEEEVKAREVKVGAVEVKRSRRKG